MKIFKTVLMICCFPLFFNGILIFPQVQETSKDKSVSIRVTEKKLNQKEVLNGDEFLENEFKSPFRFVVTNDNVVYENEEKQDVPLVRFVEVLMEKRAFNEANLIYLFKYLSKYYAKPENLYIEVHTSLMTLETLEERTAMSTHSSRDDFRQFYKTASYSRSDDRSEGFFYYTGKSGNFIRKFVNLTRQ